MDVVTLGAALNGSKKYTDQVTQSLMGGVHYRGSVSYYDDLPANPAEGDSYTVKYAGSSGSVVDGTEYTWGYDTDTGDFAWISFSKDAYSKAETDVLLGGKQATLSQAQLNAVNSGIDSTKVAQIETNKNNISLKANTSDVNTATANLQAQINEIVTPVTQDAEVQNARVDAEGNTHETLKERCDSDYNNNNATMSDYAFANSTSSNMFNENDEHNIEGGYYNPSGVYVESSNYWVSHPIYVVKGAKYKSTQSDDIGNNTVVVYVDINGNILSHFSATKVDSTLEFTAPKTGLISINLGRNYKGYKMSAYGNYAATSKYYSIDTIKGDVDDLHQIVFNTPIVTYHSSENLTDYNSMVEGYFANSAFVKNSTYISSDFIPVDNTKEYTKYCNANILGSSATKINTYNVDKEYISTIDGTTITTDYYHYDNLPSNCKFIRYTHGRKSSASPTTVYFGEGTTEPAKPFTPYTKYIDNKFNIKTEQIYNFVSGNNLEGKVWYVIGDSASHGDFSGITQPPLDSGIYAGQLPVYPFFIGNRTGMVVHNLAVNGAVIATIDGDSRYQFSVDGVYDKIVGSDADYITIWLGANDMWQNVPIGTIDSTDATTFYGAWNKLLSYYSENFPKAKLGVVVSFWITANYAEAVKAVAKKYGVPYLNLYDDDKLPVTVGSRRPDVNPDIKTMRNNQWIVSATNQHPSAKYHEIESYFIENWLKTL